MQPIPVFLLGKSHEQRNLVGYGPQGRKESDTTEVTEHTAHKDTDESCWLFYFILFFMLALLKDQ